MLILTNYALAGSEEDMGDLEMAASPQVYDICLEGHADIALEQAKAQIYTEYSEMEEDQSDLQWIDGPWMPGDPAGGRPYRVSKLLDPAGREWALVVQQKMTVSGEPEPNVIYCPNCEGTLHAINMSWDDNFATYTAECCTCGATFEGELTGKNDG